jgi:hypothetical protein
MRYLVKDRLRMLLSAVNPFGVIVDGFYRSYPSLTDAYTDLMIKLYRWAPGGYIDIPLFMVDYQGLDLVEARDLCHRRSEVVMIDWQGSEDTARDELEALLRRLMEVTGCEFNRQCFLAARERFMDGF